MHVAIVCDPRSLNSHYRAYLPLEALAARHGVRMTVHHPSTSGMTAAQFDDADVVLVHRFADDGLRTILRKAAANGSAIVYDNDDDIASMPRSNPLYRKFGGVAGQRLDANIRKLVRSADLVTTPSAVLADKYAAFGAREVRVLENCLPESFIGPARPRHDGVTVVWMAALEHQIDYQQLGLQPIFERLLARHGELRILSIGLGLGLRSPRYAHIPYVEFPNLSRALATGDVGLSPLCDIAWNHARSNVKLKEYGAAGLAWLASPIGAYRQLGEKHGGRLVGDEDWEQAIETLLREGRQRKKLAKAAFKWARDQTVVKHAQLWQRAFADAIANARTVAR